MKHFNPDFKPATTEDEVGVTYDRLRSLIERVAKFYANPESVQVMLRQYEYFADTFLPKQYVDTVAGLGYPFYFLDHPGVPIDEINSFVENKMGVLAEAKEGGQEIWSCVKCQQEHADVDVKRFCKECDVSALTPKEVFEILPDLDILMIVDNLNGFVEDDIRKTAVEANFRQSDLDYQGSIDTAERVLDSVVGAAVDENSFPIDLHVAEKATLLAAMSQIRDGQDNVVLPTRTLWSGWENRNLPFLFDFVFSLDFKDAKDQEVAEAISETRQYIYQKYSFDELMAMLATKSSRASVLLRDQKVMNNLKRRYESFQ